MTISNSMRDKIQRDTLAIRALELNAYVQEMTDTEVTAIRRRLAEDKLTSSDLRSLASILRTGVYSLETMAADSL